MSGGRWVSGGAWLIAFSCASCGASNQQGMCALPSTTAPQGTLAVDQINEFGSDYKVLSVTYALDDCTFQRSDDSALLGKQTVVFEPRKVSAGPHRFRFVIKLRHAFGANMHSEDEIVDSGIPVDVAPGGTSSITVRMFDDERADPSDRIRVVTIHKRSKNPPAEAPAAGGR